MQRLFVLLLLPVAVNISAAQTEQWSLEVDAPAPPPTLYPTSDDPDSVLVSTGTQLLRVAGDGKTLWSIDHDRALKTSATAADLDGDGKTEIAVANDIGHVFVYDADGILDWSHPFDTPTGGFKHLVAADVHPNPGLEVLAGFDDGWLNCLSADGELLWRFFGDKFRVGGTAVGDVTGDGFTDIVYGTDNGNVYCLNGWGHVQWRYAEYAPYGRSGVNLVDLDGDGAAEVLLTRSNQGSATCQMALDGRTGAFKWRAPTFMQGYNSNAIADLDGDGSLEVVHSDKGNHLYATRADGSHMWEVELGGRGIFWASAIADVDGNGQLDVIVGARGSDPNDKACVYRISADGQVLDRLALGSNANASPAIGEINDDGKLDVLVAVDGPPRLLALSWDGDGKVAWPSARGDSNMRGTRIALGKPKASGNRKDRGSFSIEDAIMSPMLGPRGFQSSWNNDPPPENSFLTVSARREHGVMEHRVVPVDSTEWGAKYDVHIAGSKPVDLTVSLHAPDGSTLRRNSTTRQPVLSASSLTEQIEFYRRLVGMLGVRAGADVSGIDDDSHKLASLAKRLTNAQKGDATPLEVTAAVNELRTFSDEVSMFLDVCRQYWTAGGKGPVAAWQDTNPWDDQFLLPGSSDLVNDPITVTAFRNEFEDIAINLMNISAEAIDVRCTFTEPRFDARPNAEPDLAKRVTLRRGLSIPKRGGGEVLDALPELDRSGVITLPPREIRQLWLVFNTHGLDDGEYELDLYLGSLSHSPSVQKIRIKLNVWQVQLPEGVYSQMNWGYIDPANASDQDLQSMLDHGISVANAPALPRLPVDENGKPNGEPDWTTFDATLARVPNYFQLMFHGEMRPQWPKGMDAAAIEAAGDAAFASGVQAMSAHLLSLGWGYDRWAFYHLDEPWLTGLTVIPQLRAFCERVRAADPRVRLYANPTGKLKVEYLEEFKDLIDVWQPEINYLKRDPDLLEWFQKNAKTLWAYEATDPGKELLPLGYYRSLGWLAFDLKLSGAGFWVYKYHDLWWPLDVGNWAVVYPSGDEVVPSRRWEACRDGQEDFRALYVLRAEIQKALDGNRMEDVEMGEKLLDEAVAAVAGWQIGTIDEITRQTRDYELDFGLLQEYRAKIADMIIELRARGAHSPIHFLGD